MRKEETSFRFYSEKESPFGPPPDNRYSVDAQGRPILLARDIRMWVSEEYIGRLLALRDDEAVGETD